MMAQTSKEGQQDITQPLGSLGCLWKLRMTNGLYHHCHLVTGQLCRGLIYKTSQNGHLLILSQFFHISFVCQLIGLSYRTKSLQNNYERITMFTNICLLTKWRICELRIQK